MSFDKDNKYLNILKFHSSDRKQKIHKYDDRPRICYKYGTKYNNKQIRCQTRCDFSKVNDDYLFTPIKTKINVSKHTYWDMCEYRTKTKLYL